MFYKAMFIVLCLALSFPYIRDLVRGEFMFERIRMEFYIHDRANLTDPVRSSTVLAAGPNNDVSEFKTFGSIMIIDDLLTTEPDANSTQVGRLQGMYLSDRKDSVAPNYHLLKSLAAVFPNGTLSIHGQEAVTEDVRYISVIGGTRAFKYVTGYMELTTHSVFPPLAVIMKARVFMVRPRMFSAVF